MSTTRTDPAFERCAELEKDASNTPDVGEDTPDSSLNNTKEKMSLPSATTTGGHEEDDRKTRMAKRLVLLKTEESQMLLALADLKKECLLMEEEVERADQKTREKLEEQKKEREVKYLTEFEKYITSEERYRYYDTTEKVTVVHTKLAKIAMAIREVEEIGSRRPL